MRLETRFVAASNHIAVEGRVEDTLGRDRAVTLLFALPLDPAGWQWGDDMRQARTISGMGEFANTVALRSGSAGRMSRYPLGAVWSANAGLA